MIVSLQLRITARRPAFGWKNCPTAGRRRYIVTPSMNFHPFPPDAAAVRRDDLRRLASGKLLG